MIYEVSLDAALVVLKMKTKGKRLKKKLNKYKSFSRSSKACLFSIIF